MDNKEAVAIIRSNWPDSKYSMLRKALDLAIKSLEIPILMTCTGCTYSHFPSDRCDACSRQGSLSRPRTDLYCSE